MTTATVLVTGAAGKLGSAIVDTMGDGYRVVSATRRELDITDDRAVAQMIQDVRPSVVVNCAAYNKVDDAEQAPEAALASNAFAVRSLARAAAACGATFVHYSTDFVFDGLKDRPYVESDPPNPRSVYAASKLLGDWFAADAPRHYVLRVESLFGGRRGTGSVDRIIDAIVEGREARVFEDRTLSPSYVEDVARTTRQVVERQLPAGLYHCVNTGYTTWADLADEAARQLGLPGKLVRVRFRDVPLPAERPQFAALSNAKLTASGIEMPHWRDALARYLEVRATRRAEARAE